MTRAMLLRSVASCVVPAAAIAAVGAALAGCPAPTMNTDAAMDSASDITADTSDDGGPLRTGEVTVSDLRTRVTVSAGPPRLRVLRADGTPWFASPPATPFLEIGVYPGGPSPARLHDPRMPAPRSVEWRAPIRVLDPPDSNTILLDDERTGRVTVRLERTTTGVYRIAVDARGYEAAMVRFNFASDDGAYHGLGERFGGVDARGTIAPMQLHTGGTVSGTNEVHVPVPFFVNTHGYGVFVESREAGAFDVASTDAGRVSATFEGHAATLYLFTDDDPLRVVAAYTRRTGLPRLPPRYAFGPMYWRNVWNDRDALFTDARRLRSEHIPTSTIWIDNPWERSYNDHQIDTTRFPDPPTMMRDIARMGMRVLFWSTPYVDAVSSGASPRNRAEELFVDARDRGLLVLTNGTPYISVASPGSAGGMGDSRGGIVDFTSPEASAWWSSLVSNVVELGARGFKLDYGEDVIVEVGGSRPGLRFASGETERTGHSTFPQGYHQSYRNALDAIAPGDGFLLVRASSWGGQRIADIIWPGDLENDFSTAADGRVGGLPAAINAMMSLAASGFPAFGSDTGGYRGGVPTREVLLRWAEHTALSPILQLGGGGDSHAPWQFDAEATRIYRSLAQLHNDLVPYLRMHAIAASRDGTPVVRSLTLANPTDAAARMDPYTYLLGEDLLVAPVTTAGATMRHLHVPRGTWVHWFDGTSFDGPRDVDVPVPLGTPALFVRRGAVIPMYAGDLETLVTSEDPTTVDWDDRRDVLRARIVPEGDRTVRIEDSTSLQSIVAMSQLRVVFTPGRDANDLRVVVDWRHAAGLPMRPTAVERPAGTALTLAPDAATVDAGCATGCWHYDDTRGVLRFALRGAATVVAR